MKIALTGATGFLGTHLIPELIKRNWAVRALIRRDPTAFEHLGPVEWVRGDLTDRTALETLVKDADAVIHAAAAVRGRTFADFDVPNRAGTEAVIAAAEAAATPRARFILVSSLAARAGHLSHYAASKAGAEHSLEATADTLQWTILRPPAVYGPGDTATLPVFRAVKRGLAPRLTGGERRFSLVHIRDVVAAIVYLIETATAVGRRVEIDDGKRQGYALPDLYGLIGETLGRRPLALPVPVPLLALGAHFNAQWSRLSGRAPMFTPEKLREITAPDWLCTGPHLDEISDWRPAMSGEDGIPATTRWYMENNWL